MLATRGGLLYAEIPLGPQQKTNCPRGREGREPGRPSSQGCCLEIRNTPYGKGKRIFRSWNPQTPTDPIQDQGWGGRAFASLVSVCSSPVPRPGPIPGDQSCPGPTCIFPTCAPLPPSLTPSAPEHHRSPAQSLRAPTMFLKAFTALLHNSHHVPVYLMVFCGAPMPGGQLPMGRLGLFHSPCIPHWVLATWWAPGEQGNGFAFSPHGPVKAPAPPWQPHKQTLVINLPVAATMENRKSDKGPARKLYAPPPSHPPCICHPIKL